jgi:hypothetical protein
MQSIIRSADTMMYYSKANGRDQISVADSSRPLEMPTVRSSRHS